MTLLAGILAGIVVAQGQAFRLSHADEPGLESVSIEWSGGRSDYAKLGAEWIAVAGIDLEATPGEHAAAIRLEYADGTIRHIDETIVVTDVSFPTTELTVEPGYVDLSPENQERAARESAEIAELYAVSTPELFWSGAFAVPVEGARNGRNFGHRRIFNGQPRAPHSGADLTASTGTPVMAANDGRVVLAKELFFSGNAVFIDHGLGLYTVYLHLSEILVEAGDRVQRGQRLGLAGATGRVTGAHLHWGARILDARIDPFSLLEIEER